MNRKWNAAVAVFGAMAAWTAAPHGQAPKADWLTDGGDPQRTAWQRNETLLTKANVKDMKLRWKIQRTLKLNASVTVPKADFSSSPLVFHFRDREVDARSAREVL